jgi:tetraacyldisaccharide-1-P 4'-kinase
VSVPPSADPLSADSGGEIVGEGAWENRWRRLILGNERGPAATAARGGLWALSQLYGGAVTAYRSAYELGLLHPVRAACRVVSVGNLTVGGTGKSTTVRWLAQRFRRRGVRVVVLSYGYRAGSEEPVTVVSDGEKVLVPESVSGDEPRMLAEALPGVPVLIGKRRQVSAAEAVRRFDAQVCVLDDAFQYWRLEKDLDIALIDARCPFGGDYLLPRGLLREPPRQIRRADIVVITNSQWVTEAERDTLYRRLSRLSPKALLAGARHRATALKPLAPGMSGTSPPPLGGDPSPLRGTRLLALSSLGNPDGFERMLSELGAEVLPARYPDHYHYGQNEVRREMERAREAGCTAVVTTEKDGVKLDPSWAEALPVWVLTVELGFDWGEEGLIERLDGLVPVG